ncbi:MAG: hypothetical protein IJQ34_06250 [Kiritimatiellae bacterium]|nr:hypothetical protein [Kiritimatiellia bacterium]
MKKIAAIYSLIVLPTCLLASVTTDCQHPAAIRAKEIIESKCDESIELIIDSSRKDDGYRAEKDNGVIKIYGLRPRSFLYAAGEIERLKTSRFPLERKSPFKLRMLNYTGRKYDVAYWVAATGCNYIELPRRTNARMVEACHNADVECYAFLYGCDPMKWNKQKCEEFLAAHPSAKGSDIGRSWEKGIMCPSDKYTWQYFASTITELAQYAPFDGVVVTFWDDYGLNCHCKKCRAKGLDSFDAQVAEAIKCYEKALNKIGKKLIVRTWSSGCPHFLGEEWVHAPGYGGSGGDAMSLWGKSFNEASNSTIIQTKVYNSDCQPNAPFSPLLGEATKAGFTELAEWQITGQTLGLGWLPASVVNHTQWTMRKALDKVGENGGICLYAGGYNNQDYEALDDIMNSINIYAWRELSWNPNDNIDDIWMEWARPIYGKASSQVVEALKLSEKACTISFSPLGFGAPTESRFASNISRREDLLRYTNRYYLKDSQELLKPTKENIALVVGEKDEALECVNKMELAINAAREIEPNAPWLEELTIRTDWLKTHLICSKALDGALWRYRYLRYLRDICSSDIEEFKNIEEDFNTIKANHTKLFAHEPELKLSFYQKPCLDRPITLSSPIPLMRDIHSNAVECVEKILGPRR